MIFKIETDTLELLIEYSYNLKEYKAALLGDDRQMTFKNLMQGKIENKVITVRKTHSIQNLQ